MYSVSAFFFSNTTHAVCNAYNSFTLLLHDLEHHNKNFISFIVQPERNIIIVIVVAYRRLLLVSLLYKVEDLNFHIIVWCAHTNTLHKKKTLRTHYTCQGKMIYLFFILSTMCPRPVYRSQSKNERNRKKSSYN